MSTRIETSCSHPQSRIIDTNEWVRITTQLSEVIISQCADCGIVFSNGYPTDYKTLEEVNRRLSVSFDVPETRSIDKAKIVSDLVSDANGLGPDDYTLVDFGGGTGRTAKAFRNIGVEAYSYDPWATVDSSVNSSIFLYDVSSLNSAKPLVVSLFHVLEHVSHPVHFLADLKRTFANKDITIVVEVPVLELELPSSSDPTPYWAPFHVSHFSLLTATKVLEAAGWAVVSNYSFPDYNGAIFVAVPSFGVERGTALSKSQLQREINLVDMYVDERAHFIEEIRRKLDSLLLPVSTVVLWGVGVGLDAFFYTYGEQLADKELLYVDSSSGRQGSDLRGFEVHSPQNLATMLSEKTQEEVLLVPTSYAKSREIEMEFKAKFPSSHSLSYPLVRAY